MKATKDHISLETAKMLEGCEIDSGYVFQQSFAGCYTKDTYEMEGSLAFLPKKETRLTIEAIPAYTWSEILWEHAEEFFGLSEWSKEYNTPSFFEKSRELLFLLIEKKYDEADEYFRKNCVFIKDSKAITNSKA